jgi:hypothetical protein
VKKLRPHKIDWAQIDRFMKSAEKKLASASQYLKVIGADIGARKP